MKIKDGYILRDVAGSHIVVPLGSAELDLGGMMTLNEVGAFVWRALEQETTEAAVVQALLAEYDIDKETATQDVHRYIQKLIEKGVVEA